MERRVSLENPFDEFDPSVHPDAVTAAARVREWCYAAHRGESRGLVLWANDHAGGSGYGCGKTKLALCAFRYLLQCSTNGPRGIRIPVGVTFLNTVDFYGELKDAYSVNKPEWPIFKSWSDTHFVLDDFGKEYISANGAEWAREKFYRMINMLYERRSFLMTSNMNTAEIERIIGGASWSRLLGMCGEHGFVDMSAIPDYRLAKAGL